MKNIAIITALALFHGIGCASAGPDSDWEDEADVGSVEQAQQAAQGQDAPGKSCIRNNRNGSSTSGKCEDVCKDKTIYEPHPSEDPAGTYGICKEAARVRADAFTQVFSEAASAATLSQ